jgi:hypothetical protein
MFFRRAFFFTLRADFDPYEKQKEAEERVLVSERERPFSLWTNRLKLKILGYRT